MIINKLDSKVIITIAFFIVSTTSISLPNIINSFFDVTFDEGIEILKSKGYQITNNLKWNEIFTAGIKTTESSWNGFLQVCERIVLDLGNLQVCVDLEARVMFVYAESTESESEKQVYYIQFLGV